MMPGVPPPRPPAPPRGAPWGPVSEPLFVDIQCMLSLHVFTLLKHTLFCLGMFSIWLSVLAPVSWLLCINSRRWMGGLQANATSLTSRDLSLRVPAPHSPTRGEPRGGVTTLAHYFLKFNSEAASPVRAERRSAHDFLQTSGGKFEHCPGPCQTAVCRGTWAVAAIRLTVTLRLSSSPVCWQNSGLPARLRACIRILLAPPLLGGSAWH